MFLPPDFFADLLEEGPKLVIRHVALFDLAAERGENLIERRAPDVSVDELADIIGGFLPASTENVGSVDPFETASW